MNRIPELMLRIEATSRSAPKKVADLIAASARKRAPYKTGFLRRSIESVSISTGKVAEVRVGADYGRYVEFGTYKMSAQPFLLPAYTEFANLLHLWIMAPLVKW